MKQYAKVDIVDSLKLIVDFNTQHYGDEDFAIDVKTFEDAAKNGGGVFLWLSRGSGTNCVPERLALIKPTSAHSVWTYYAEQHAWERERLIAFMVEVTGTGDNGHPIGNLYHIADYATHAAWVAKRAVDTYSSRLTYEKGELVVDTTQHSNFDYHHEKLGELLHIEPLPSDEAALELALDEEREIRRLAKTESVVGFVSQIQRERKKTTGTRKPRRRQVTGAAVATN